MADVQLKLPPSLSGVEVVKSVRTPAELRYLYTPGAATTRFLTGIAQKKILGEKCPVCGKVYVPPRGSCPRDGVPTRDQVDLPHTGTLTSFCIVNVQFYGQGMEVPYTSGLIKLDGADLPLMHLLQEVAVEDVRIGMRVEAVWVPDAEIGPTLESIRYFRPNGEPDAEVDQPGEHGWGALADGYRDVAIISFAQSNHVRAVTDANEVEMLMPVTAAAVERAGMSFDDIGFTCSGSTDYLAGTAFSFVSTLDGVGPWPPIQESHVEMDGAWALYEAWVKLQLGEVDSALIYSYSKSSPGPVHEVLSRQLDPYFVAPLWPDAISLAALQARALIEAGKATEKEFAEVVARSRASALDNPHAQLRWNKSADEVLAEAPLIDPLRKDDCPPISDGVAAVVIAADDVARSHCGRPAWIRGIDHRIETAVLGLRDLTESPSTRVAGERAGLASGKVDLAELHAPFSHQELILRAALGLGDDVDVNPSGGALCANPIMAAGLVRFGEAAQRVIDGQADRAVAHATSGACLQQNIVCVLEGNS